MPERLPYVCHRDESIKQLGIRETSVRDFVESLEYHNTNLKGFQKYFLEVSVEYNSPPESRDAETIFLRWIFSEQVWNFSRPWVFVIKP